MSRPTVRIDTTEFDKAIDSVMANVEKGIRDEVMAKVAMDTLRNFQRITPRKTGRARAGWNTTVDQPPSEWAPDAGFKSYKPTSFNGDSTIKFDSVINFSNNVEYIVFLEEGRSQQAPGGMIQPVLSRLTAQLNAVARAQSRRVIK